MRRPAARDAIRNQRDLLVQERSAEVYQEHQLAARGGRRSCTCSPSGGS